VGMSGKSRSGRWRERKRQGLMSVTIDVSPTHRRAFERMGLVKPGYDKDREALTWAVERYLDTAQAVQGIGDALYKGAADFTVSDGADDEEIADETPSPDNNDENAGYP